MESSRSYPWKYIGLASCVGAAASLAYLRHHSKAAKAMLEKAEAEQCSHVTEGFTMISESSSDCETLMSPRFDNLPLRMTSLSEMHELLIEEAGPNAFYRETLQFALQTITDVDGGMLLAVVPDNLARTLVERYVSSVDGNYLTRRLCKPKSEVVLTISATIGPNLCVSFTLMSGEEVVSLQLPIAATLGDIRRHLYEALGNSVRFRLITVEGEELHWKDECMFTDCVAVAEAPSSLPIDQSLKLATAADKPAQVRQFHVPGDPQKLSSASDSARRMRVPEDAAEVFPILMDFTRHTDDDRWPADHADEAARRKPKDGAIVLSQHGTVLCGAVRIRLYPQKWSLTGCGTRHHAGLGLAEWLSNRQQGGLVFVRSESGSIKVFSARGLRDDHNAFEIASGEVSSFSSA
jgi:hypothetical protein